MFTTIQCGPTGGDCTARHSVQWKEPGPHTVGQFLDDLLVCYPGEWGGIDIRSGQYGSYETIATARYQHGAFESMYQITDEIRGKVIKSISASGGWSNMDYLIVV